MANLIGELEYIESGADIEENYPQLADGQAKQFLLQTDELLYTMSVSINYVGERLYFRIKNESQKEVISFTPLVEDTNLVGSVLEGYELVFKDNKVYFGKI